MTDVDSFLEEQLASVKASRGPRRPSPPSNYEHGDDEAENGAAAATN
ncbi:unnamed protein product, partial [Sphacelaria rigidula]